MLITTSCGSGSTLRAASRVAVRAPLSTSSAVRMITKTTTRAFPSSWTGSGVLGQSLALRARAQPQAQMKYAKCAPSSLFKVLKLDRSSKTVSRFVMIRRRKVRTTHQRFRTDSTGGTGPRCVLGQRRVSE